MSSRQLKKVRKTLKLTQRAAAELVHVSPNTWARWERGESKPRGLFHRDLIANLPRAARRRNSRRVQAKLPPAVLPEAMPHSTGAIILEWWADENGGKRKARRRLTEASSNRSNEKNKFRSTGATWLKFAGTWVGDDAERCLELVHATRGLAKF